MTNDAEDKAPRGSSATASPRALLSAERSGLTMPFQIFARSSRSVACANRSTAIRRRIGSQRRLAAAAE